MIIHEPMTYIDSSPHNRKRRRLVEGLAIAAVVGFSKQALRGKSKSAAFVIEVSKNGFPIAYRKNLSFSDPALISLRLLFALENGPFGASK